MKNRMINLDVVAEVAKALGELNKQVVFVGGAIVSVYADDEAADEIRPTKDIDLTLKLITMNSYQLDSELAKKGFMPDSEGTSICSYKYKDIAIDIMSSTETMRGPTNSWYQIGFDSLESIMLKGIAIEVLSAPCFMASKFEAYHDRGNEDYRMSHDFEDIIYVLDNCSSIVEDISKADFRIKAYLKTELQAILNSHYREEIIASHLHPLIAEQRFKILLDRVLAIVK